MLAYSPPRWVRIACGLWQAFCVLIGIAGMLAQHAAGEPVTPAPLFLGVFVAALSTMVFFLVVDVAKEFIHGAKLIIEAIRSKP